MTKSQPKIDDIKDLKKATDVSDGLMSKEDWIKLDGLDASNFAEDSQTIDFDISNEEPEQIGNVTKTSTWLWQYLTQSINFLWLKLKTWVGGLFSDGSATTNNNYLPKIDDVNKKLVKSNISDDGNRVQIDSPLRVNSKTFYNVAQRISNTINEIGTIYIELPFGWTSNMGTYEIDIYNYSSNAKAKIIVSGYNLSGAGGVWINTSLQIVGKLPSNVVRLGYNSVTQKCCILIGNTNSVWGYPQIYVSKVSQGYGNSADWSTGWSISLITDETNITNIVTPTANVDMMLDGKTLTEQIADNNDRYLGITATATDSDMLDGNHASDFATSAQGTKADTAYTHSQSPHAPADALTNSLLFRGELWGATSPIPASFQSGNLLNGIYDIIPEITYYDVPNESCGTDASKSEMKGILTIKENENNNIRTLIYHDAINNNLYICSANYVGTSWVHSNWKRLLTCLDTTDVIEQEGEEYGFTLERNNTEIYIPSEEGAFDSKNDKIEINVSNLIIGGRCHFWVYFSVPITGAININIETNDSNPRTYGSFYVDPSMIPSSQIVSGIEYIVWRHPTTWHIVNRIF